MERKEIKSRQAMSFTVQPSTNNNVGYINISEKPDSSIYENFISMMHNEVKPQIQKLDQLTPKQKEELKLRLFGARKSFQEIKEWKSTDSEKYQWSVWFDYMIKNFEVQTVEVEVVEEKKSQIQKIEGDGDGSIEDDGDYKKALYLYNEIVHPASIVFADPTSANMKDVEYIQGIRDTIMEISSLLQKYQHSDQVAMYRQYCYQVDVICVRELEKRKISDNDDERLKIFHEAVTHHDHVPVARFFHNEYRNNYYVTEDQGSIYCFDDKNNIWKEYTESIFRKFVIHGLDVLLEQQKVNYIELMKNSNDPERKDRIQNFINLLGQLIHKVHTLSYITSVTRIICILYGDKDHIKKFNNLPNMLSVRNGMIDLKTGQLVPRTREHFTTMMLDIEYHPKIKSERLLNVIHGIMLEDKTIEKPVTEFIKRLLGYSICADPKQQIFAILHGVGSNGKSLLTRGLLKLLGCYIKMAPKEAVMVPPKGNNASPILHSLRGSRINVINETEEGEVLCESVIKQLTGSDTIVSRPLYGSPVEWTPVAVNFLVTNHLPVCSGSFAMLRRVMVINFGAIFTENPKAPNERSLDRTVEDMWNDPVVLQAFLNWIVSGAVEYNKSGLNPPQQVQLSTQEYKDSMDSIKLFIDENIEKDLESKTSSSQVYEAYRRYCAREGYTPKTQTAFGRRMSELGYEKKKSSGIVYSGIKLINQGQVTPNGSLLSF